ncbi:hypothetical protein V1523DRAFT_438463 [Lipomyces doorenjongii]
MLRKTAPDASERDSYDRALHFLKANKPEKRLDVHLSFESLRALEKQAQALYGNAKYPRVEYSAADSRFSSGKFTSYIRDCIQDVLVKHGRQSLLRLLMSVGHTACEFTDDQGTGTSKSPDNGFKCVRLGGLADLVFVIEVSVSEGYQVLKVDIMLWLNHSRGGKDLDIPGVPMHSVSNRPAFESAMKQAQLAHPFGPCCYRDHACFGTMHTAIIEVFKRNPTSGTITTEKKLVADIHTAPIHPDTESLSLVLAFGAQDTAVVRFQKLG